MSSPTPILNAALPPAFRQIRIELAREQGHPDGAHNIAYVLVAPLDPDGHIDAEAWRRHREACRVARLRPGQATVHGHLVHRRGGSWASNTTQRFPMRAAITSTRNVSNPANMSR